MLYLSNLSIWASGATGPRNWPQRGHYATGWRGPLASANSLANNRNNNIRPQANCCFRPRPLQSNLAGRINNIGQAGSGWPIPGRIRPPPYYRRYWPQFTGFRPLAAGSPLPPLQAGQLCSGATGFRPAGRIAQPFIYTYIRWPLAAAPITDRRHDTGYRTNDRAGRSQPLGWQSGPGPQARQAGDNLATISVYRAISIAGIFARPIIITGRPLIWAHLDGD